MGDVHLPDGLPEDLRAFIECRADTATITNGPLDWVRIPEGAAGFLGGDGKPELAIRPGEPPGSAILDIRLGWLAVSLPARVEDGRLEIDTSKLPFWAPKAVGADVRRFVDSLNGTLAANGRALAPPTFGPAGMTIAKVDRAIA